MFRPTDWRLLRVVAIAAIPAEILSIRLLSTLPLDFEPSVKPSLLRLWVGLATEVIHLPAFPLLQTPLINHKILLRGIFFLTGYIDLLLLFGLILLLNRAIRKLF